MSLLPLPLDQGSHPNWNILLSKERRARFSGIYGHYCFKTWTIIEAEWRLQPQTTRVRVQPLEFFYKEHLFTVNYWKDVYKEKSPGKGHLKHTTGASCMFLIGQSRPLFVYFRPFLITISIVLIGKSLNGVLGIRTNGRRMEGTDETTELYFCVFLLPVDWQRGFIKDKAIWNLGQDLQR